MTELTELAALRAATLKDLTENILPFWMRKAADHRYGGFVGRITEAGAVVPEAAKGVVLNARILWTFSSATRQLPHPDYRRTADRAYEYLRDHFIDKEFGGVYWSVNYLGEPLDRRKQIYAQAFAIYGLAAYYLASGDEAARRSAFDLFDLVEQYGYDSVGGGYFEAFAQDWSLVEDVRLSEKDLNAPKSMNTLLHVMEAYAALHRISPTEALRERLAELVALFIDTVRDPETGHMRTFFSEGFDSVSPRYSFGHDIEAAWLVYDAAEAVGDEALLERARAFALETADLTIREGLDEDGGLLNEADASGWIDTDKHWWPQAEAMVGFLNAYELSGSESYVRAATQSWDFIARHVINREQGEWRNRLHRDGTPYEGEDRLGLWKCPYHNSRACLEIMRRVPAPLSKAERIVRGRGVAARY